MQWDEKLGAYFPLVLCSGLESFNFSSFYYTYAQVEPSSMHPLWDFYISHDHHQRLPILCYLPHSQTKPLGPKAVLQSQNRVHTHC